MGDGSVLAIVHASLLRAYFCGKGWAAGASLRGVPVADWQLGAQRSTDARGPAAPNCASFNPAILEPRILSRSPAFDRAWGVSWRPASSQKSGRIERLQTACGRESRCSQAVTLLRSSGRRGERNGSQLLEISLYEEVRPHW